MVEAFHLAEKSDVKLIASGGQGPDELISEAQAITDYLESIDFPVDRLIWEDKSTTTFSVPASMPRKSVWSVTD
ncbi:YdcF family protein [Streptococcus suis]|uniref:YdcF family protein n=1 Tax=Streptococcus suis TaxID=1307 RepID=UPI0032D594E5